MVGGKREGGDAASGKERDRWLAEGERVYKVVIFSKSPWPARQFSSNPSPEFPSPHSLPCSSPPRPLLSPRRSHCTPRRRFRLLTYSTHLLKLDASDSRAVATDVLLTLALVPFPLIRPRVNSVSLRNRCIAASLPISLLLIPSLLQLDSSFSPWCDFSCTWLLHVIVTRTNAKIHLSLSIDSMSFQVYRYILILIKNSRIHETISADSPSSGSGQGWVLVNVDGAGGAPQADASATDLPSVIPANGNEQPVMSPQAKAIVIMDSVETKNKSRANTVESTETKSSTKKRFFGLVRKSSVRSEYISMTSNRLTFYLLEKELNTPVKRRPFRASERLHFDQVSLYLSQPT